MGGGLNTQVQYNHSVVEGEGDLVMRYSGECNFTCIDIQDGSSVIIINSTVGGITFSQKCSVDATCVFKTQLDALVCFIQGVANKQKLEEMSGYLNTNIQQNDSA